MLVKAKMMAEGHTDTLLNSMKMPKNNSTSLRSSIIAAGNLSTHTLVGLDAKASWGDLVYGSIFEDCSLDFRGKCVLVATLDQFRAAAALVELDGVARRVILFPPDVSRDHLPYVAKTAAADILVTDQPEVAAMDHGISHAVQCSKNLTPRNFDRSAEIETEWILLTSGTTGIPKLAVHTLASLAGSAKQSYPSENSIVWSTYYDMRRYGGLHIFLHASLTGTSLVLSSALESTADFLARAGAHGVTHITGTPSHWRRALMSPSASRIAPEYLRMSGEIVDQVILNQVKSQFPLAKIAHTFASTEAGVGFDVNDGLMGFPVEVLTRNPLVEMKVQDGTLRIRSARAASCYLGANSPILKDAEGFVDTGDTVELRDGRFYFTGRRDGMINVGGHKVHPEEVEAVINRHPVVAMSLVKAKKNPITGALVVADVVIKSLTGDSSASASSAHQRDILQFCRAELDPHKVPTVINIVPVLAIGESGKLVRHA
jgi:acyl-coenzyme A synthetase/AMP-(fatty) acid ligase